METLSHLRLSREETSPFRSTSLLLSSLAVHFSLVNGNARDVNFQHSAKQEIIDVKPQCSQVVQILQTSFTDHGYPDHLWSNSCQNVHVVNSKTSLL